MDMNLKQRPGLSRNCQCKELKQFMAPIAPKAITGVGMPMWAVARGRTVRRLTGGENDGWIGLDYNTEPGRERLLGVVYGRAGTPYLYSSEKLLESRSCRIHPGVCCR